ncbi:hypothetical protein M141_1400 [Bacteroides fragilis str. S38L5]|nr:hypothetical protein M085_1260 [Bacteroides fragilis str. 3986 N(B)19]EYA39888.1 hypothetical protein M075_1563 [Bacteroides fragilis str. 20793-3]EYA49022.1 hypothetical protein M115_1363 [Bacteroides fragilis str. 3719 T6]EYA96635.1 hypothetical protein M141_1400 [Bacteroides fragilis str. S38L5]EYB15612.1 hypothetical protein M140_1343 [Bacteroides fragilis str. S38L3]KXU41417.1 hypothetical protein HMPREF2530_04024 [Bacteroides fragilis]
MATPGSWSFLAGLTIGYRKKGVLLVTKLYRVFIIGHPLSFFSLETQCFPFLAQGLNIEA